MYLALFSDIANYMKNILQNATGEVVWLCNVTTIKHEREKCESSVFRKECLVYPR